MIGCLFLAGCGAYLESMFTDTLTDALGDDPTKFLCLGVDPPTALSEVPAEVLYVIDHRDEFDSTDHPLNDVPPGTVIDDLAEAADGCWANIRVESMENPSLDLSPMDELPADVERVDFTIVSVLKIDLDDDLLQMQEFQGVDGSVALFDDLPMLLMKNREIVEVTENTLELDWLYSDGALAFDDGTVRGDCWPSALASEQTLFYVKTTIEGDAMTTTTPSRYDEPLNLRWTRFPCATEEIELFTRPDPVPPTIEQQRVITQMQLWMIGLWFEQELYELSN
jgi:hypothetical protein